MMQIFQVQSIPLKDVIIDLANAFGVPYQQDCEEYYLDIPKNLGVGQIRGINFSNGLGLISYKANFKKDIRLEFTLNEVHPVKYIYSLHGPLVHSFENEDDKHEIKEFSCAIVASKKRNGHIIEFSKEVDYQVLSVEIDRKQLLKQAGCELEKWHSTLQNLLTDTQGKNEFYQTASCGVYIKDISKELDKYEDFMLARKFNLNSITMQIFIFQLAQYEDDLLSKDQRTILRIQELKRVAEIAGYVKSNLSKDLSIKNLTRKTGLNPNKLQHGFNYLYNSTINEFIMASRLEKANELLKSKEYNVAAVVAAIGLESSSYFSKIYKKKYGISPKSYKKMFS